MISLGLSSHSAAKLYSEHCQLQPLASSQEVSGGAYMKAKSQVDLRKKQVSHEYQHAEYVKGCAASHVP